MGKGSVSFSATAEPEVSELSKGSTFASYQHSHLYQSLHGTTSSQEVQDGDEEGSRATIETVHYHISKVFSNIPTSEDLAFIPCLIQG